MHFTERKSILSFFVLFQWVMNALDSQLFAMTGDSFGALRTQLWNTIDEEISLADCDIYRYTHLHAM